MINAFQSFIYIFFYEKAYIIYDIIAYCCKLDIKYHGIIQTIFVDSEFWVFPLTLVFYILSEIGLWLTIYYFSPCHFIILEILEDFLELIFAFLDKNDKLYNIDIKGQIITFCVLYLIIFLHF